jgi:hypothetical protein
MNFIAFEKYSVVTIVEVPSTWKGFICRKQSDMWLQGDLHRSQNNKNTNEYPKHSYGIYSIEYKSLDFKIVMENDELVVKCIKPSDNVSRILQKVDTMKLDDQEDENKNERSCRRKVELIEVRTAVSVVKNIVKIYLYLYL